ncbi:MAG TPA: hypothetical protein VLB87_11085, partial [Pyrinomonadaceae bacterium]|nr:hypothetical protein [Pyrinomonadaceae bacterium]
WVLDNVSSLHQLSFRESSEPILFKPRDGYRTRLSPTVLGPVVDYYLPAAPVEPIIIEILDSKGAVVNSYNSDTPAPRPGRGPAGANMPGVGGAGPESQPADPDAAPVRRGTPPPRVTKVAGLNRFAWDVRNQAGVMVLPGHYQVRLKSGSTTLVQPLNVLIDPRVAADGVTLADLQEQFDHNMRVRELVNEVNQLVNRVRDAQNKSKTTAGSGNGNISSEALNAVAAKLLTEPVRYGKPGLQAHITYLAGMTANVDQKIGRDAIQRYEVLKKELETTRAEVDRILGPPLKSQL